MASAQPGDRITVTKSPLVPANANTQAIPKPWNLYNETTGELLGCFATRAEAEAARPVKKASHFYSPTSRHYVRTA